MLKLSQVNVVLIAGAERSATRISMQAIRISYMARSGGLALTV
jgi:hypothetical protein